MSADGRLCVTGLESLDKLDGRFLAGPGRRCVWAEHKLQSTRKRRTGPIIAAHCADGMDALKGTAGEAQAADEEGHQFAIALVGALALRAKYKLSLRFVLLLGWPRRLGPSRLWARPVRTSCTMQLPISLRPHRGLPALLPQSETGTRAAPLSRGEESATPV